MTSSNRALETDSIMMRRAINKNTQNIGDHTHDAEDIVSGTLPNERYDAYGNLIFNSKVGTNADQVAPGNILDGLSENLPVNNFANLQQQLDYLMTKRSVADKIFLAKNYI